MTKPLSETHPTITTQLLADKELMDSNTKIHKRFCDLIQSFTVDVAEHEALKKQLFEAVNNYGNLQDEVERLKKQSDDWMKHSDSWLTEARHYKAEVERLKKHAQMEYARGHEEGLGNYVQASKDFKDEIERLKKELEELRGVNAKVVHDNLVAFDDGFNEGELRAMERVNEAIEMCPSDIDNWTMKEWLLKELGLGEESTDNDNYANKGAE